MRKSQRESSCCLLKDQPCIAHVRCQQGLNILIKPVTVLLRVNLQTAFMEMAMCWNSLSSSQKESTKVKEGMWLSAACLESELLLILLQCPQR